MNVQQNSRPNPDSEGPKANSSSNLGDHGPDGSDLKDVTLPSRDSSSGSTESSNSLENSAEEQSRDPSSADEIVSCIGEAVKDSEVSLSTSVKEKFYALDKGQQEAIVKDCIKLMDGAVEKQKPDEFLSIVSTLVEIRDFPAKDLTAKNYSNWIRFAEAVDSRQGAIKKICKQNSLNDNTQETLEGLKRLVLWTRLGSLPALISSYRAKENNRTIKDTLLASKHAGKAMTTFLALFLKRGKTVALAKLGIIPQAAPHTVTVNMRGFNLCAGPYVKDFIRDQPSREELDRRVESCASHVKPMIKAVCGKEPFNVCVEAMLAYFTRRVDMLTPYSIQSIGPVEAVDEETACFNITCTPQAARNIKNFEFIASIKPMAS